MKKSNIIKILFSKKIVLGLTSGITLLVGIGQSALAKPIPSWIRETWLCEIESGVEGVSLKSELKLWYPEGQVVVLDWNLEKCQPNSEGEKECETIRIDHADAKDQVDGADFSKVLTGMTFDGELSYKDNFYFHVLRQQEHKELRGYIYTLDTLSEGYPVMAPLDHSEFLANLGLKGYFKRAACTR